MLGPSLLAAPVVEPGARQRRVRPGPRAVPCVARAARRGCSSHVGRAPGLCGGPDVAAVPWLSQAYGSEDRCRHSASSTFAPEAWSALPRQVYLPRGPAAWYDFYSGEAYAPGAAVTVAAPLERLPLLVAAGGMLALTDEAEDFGRLHDEPSRCLRCAPPAASQKRVHAWKWLRGRQRYQASRPAQATSAHMGAARPSITAMVHA